MKQILQSLKNGKIEIIEAPCPQVKVGHVLIKTRCSLISTGTERMLLEFGQAGLINKARSQPEKVRMVLDKIKTDGLLTTWNAVQRKLDNAIAMGYSNVGEVIAVGKDVQDFCVGDRVVSNGHHAEIVTVPVNLCAKIPDAVSDDEAVFTIVAAIALQGIRLCAPTLGEKFVVVGLGLIGLLTVQLLRAAGCHVLGVDLDSDKLALAKQYGANVVDVSAGEEMIAAAEQFSQGRGVDGVLLTAATKSNEPVHQAALMSRQRGRIICVGVVGLELSRDDFYEKELTFQVSCSYGPGRYDENYEKKGQDYPFGFVRWTEKRNFEAVLDLFSVKKLSSTALISHRFAFEKAQDAYDILTSKNVLGMILDYSASSSETMQQRTIIFDQKFTAEATSTTIAMIGCGNYAQTTLLPALKKCRAQLNTIVSASGVTAASFAKRYGFKIASTDFNSVLSDDQIENVIICTPHHLHASMTCQAIRAGKRVFVEKPLAMTLEEITEIEEALMQQQSQGKNPTLMVGFNRRYSSLTKKLRALLQPVKAPKYFIMTVNAGKIPMDHWTQDPAVGGGRILGEACHFIDLLRHLANAPIVDFQSQKLGVQFKGETTDDKALVTLRFEDGSMGTIHYLGNGHKRFPKERLEVFVGGRVLQLDNFRKLVGHGFPHFRQRKLYRQDKGNEACIQAFLKNDVPFCSLQELIEVSKITIEIANTLR